MVGYGSNKGIVLISCEKIFKRISNNKDPSIYYEVEVSKLKFITKNCKIY